MPVSKEASVASKKEASASLKHPSMWKTMRVGSLSSHGRAGWVDEALASTIGANFFLPRSVDNLRPVGPLLFLRQGGDVGRVPERIRRALHPGQGEGSQLSVQNTTTALVLPLPRSFHLHARPES
jgi:hypothetical protein